MRKSSTLIAAVAAAAVALLAGCQRGDEDSATQEPPASSGAPAVNDNPPEGVLRAYVWECDGGLTLHMRNLFREKAISLELHEGARKLLQLPSASGARFGDDSVVFWTKGGTATFERKGSPVVQCREDRARSLAADARLRGVAFRGTGNEPGWVLEVGPGNTLVFVTNYGQERYEFSDSTVSGDVQTSAGYSAAHDGATLSATIRKEPCADDMAGTAFDYSFVVEFGGRTYRGCGDNLR